MTQFLIKLYSLLLLLFSVIDLQKKWKSIKDAYNRDKAKNRNCASGSGAKPRRPYIYSSLLTFLDSVAEIRPPSQCSNNSGKNDDAAQEHDENCDFQKPNTPKLSKINPKNEDPTRKIVGSSYCKSQTV